jgi:hypothetical protein
MLASTQLAPPGGPQYSSSSSNGRGSQDELSDVVLRAIVACGGQTKLAAERLARDGVVGTPDKPATASELALHLQGRLPELKEKMELVATLELFSLMPQLHKTLVESLSSLEGSDSVRAYMDLMGLIQKATSKNELTVNVHEEVWHRAPVDIKKLFAQLEAAGQLEALDEVARRLELAEHNQAHTHIATQDRTYQASRPEPDSPSQVIDHEPNYQSEMSR